MSEQKEARVFSSLKTAVSAVSQQIASAKHIKIQRVSVPMEHAEALVEFAKAAERELGARTKAGSVNSLPFQSLDWLDENRETLVERYKTPWKEAKE